jgi:DNA repair protein RecO (recombination protein O)
LHIINSSEVIEPFYEIRNDIVKLTHAAHIADIVNDIIQEDQPSNRLLQLFLNSLHMLAKTGKSPELITRIFELRCLSIIGYAPHISGCMGVAVQSCLSAFSASRTAGLSAGTADA